MRALLRTVCLFVLGTGVLLATRAYRTRWDIPAPAAAVPAADPRALDRFTLDVGDSLEVLDGLGRLEVADQARDWAVYGTLLRAGLDPDRIALATHKTAPVRLPYLRDVVLFDHGPGRRAIVAEAEVWLFHDADDLDPDATLGRLADKVRMETGAEPEQFVVFAITADLANGAIRIERTRTISGKDLYGPAFGYVERSVTNLTELAAWVDAVDDLVSVRRADDALVLAGRRFPGRRTRGVTLEDVAALYQAHVDLAEHRKRLEVAIDAKASEYQRLANAQPGRFKSLQAQFDAEVGRMPRPPAEPGFSLDPQWRMERFGEAMAELATAPQRTLARAVQMVMTKGHESADDARPAALWAAHSLAEFAIGLSDAQRRALLADVVERYGERFREVASSAKSQDGNQDDALVAFYRLNGELKATDEPAAQAAHRLLQFVEGETRIQCARYDGLLQGTSVGMNLFYTDLLAKLWEALDAHRSAPVVAVPGFLSKPRMTQSATFRPEQIRLPATRLWFGIKPESFARESNGSAVWFDHVATRVYAAGSDPTNPGHESEPAESSRRSLGWWDRHYAAVADYEQEYHVQNQIMKWSVVTGWLREAGEATYLRDVPVRHDFTFDAWLVQAGSRLRYRAPVELLPRDQWIGGTECIDILASYPFDDTVQPGRIWQVTGGVSLGGRKSLDAVAQLDTAAPRLQRFLASARTPDGLLTRARPVYEGAGRIAAKGVDATRWRTGTSDLRLGEMRLTAAANGRTPQLALDSGEGHIGTLRAATVDDELRLTWDAGEVERTRVLAERAAERLADDVIVDEGRTVAKLAEAASRASDRPPVVLADRGEVLAADSHGTMLRLVADEGADVDPKSLAVAARPHGPRLVPGPDGPRIAKPGVTGVRVDHLPADQAGAMLDRQPWQQVFAVPDAADRPAAQGLRRAFGSRGPPPDSVEVRVRGVGDLPDGFRVQVADDGSMYVPRPQEDAALAIWRNLDEAAGLTPRDLQKIVAAAKRGPDQVVDLAGTQQRRARDVAAAIQHDDPAEALRRLSSGSADDARAAVIDAEQRLRADADVRLASGDGEGAARLYERLGRVFGDASPETLVKQGLAQVASGRPTRGKSAVEQLLRQPTRPSEDVARILDSLAGDPTTSHDMQVLARSLAGDEHAVPRETLRRFEVVADGPQLATAWKLERGATGHALDLGQRAKLLSKDADTLVAYLDDGFSMNRFDFENSGDLLSQLATDTTVRWTEITDEPVRAVMPAQLVARGEATRYTRVRIPTQATRVVVIQRCDSDGDGTVSAGERAACEKAA